MPKFIEPKILKGFRDQLPEATIPRQEMVRKIEDVFSSFGFAPIDTPALEYSEILLGKGSAETDKQMFRFTDAGGRDVSLRFDLTIPFARFVAAHLNDLPIPFKRYHIAPVWRAEKPQRGRFREFIQCDFDTIGTESLLADAEIVAVMHRAFSALGVRHQISLNNRILLNGLMQQVGAGDRTADVLRVVDKLDKLGEETVRKELETEVGLSEKQISELFRLLDSGRELGARPAELLKKLSSMLDGNADAAKGIAQLETVLQFALTSGVSDESVRVDLSIARGLDYYTGTVFEGRFLDLPDIGAVSAGGRYDDLASLYCNRRLPGVGASIGLDRLMAAMEELGRLGKRNSPAQALVALLDERSTGYATQIASELRNAGLRIELFPDQIKLGNQMKFADRKGIRYVIIAGEREMSAGTVSVKDLSTGEQQDGLSIADLVRVIARA